MQFHVPNVGKKILRITDKLIYLTALKPVVEEPPGFCMFLRKQLDNSRLKEINQKESERIIELVFEKKEGIYISSIEKTLFDCFLKPRFIGFTNITKALYDTKIEWDKFIGAQPPPIEPFRAEVVVPNAFKDRDVVITVRKG